MKAGLFAASAIALVQLVAAQPHGKGHRHVHERRDDVARVTTTVYQPEVVVFVDEDGSIVSQATQTVSSSLTSLSLSSTTTTSTSSSKSSTTSSSSSSSSSTSTPSSTSTSTTSSSTYIPPTTSSTSTSSIPTTSSTPVTTAAPTTSSTPTSSAAASTSAAVSVSSGSTAFASVKGAALSFYNSDGSCMSSSQVSSTVGSLAAEGFKAIRFYGVDCNQVANAVSAAKSNGMYIIAGLFNIGGVSSDLDSMKSQLNGDFSSLSAITVYNEAINNGEASPAAVASAIYQAKDYLKSTNFGGLVATVDTYNQLLSSANSAVIAASDFIAANCHPWFDTSVSPSGAADFVQNSCIKPLEAIAGGKAVVITESGWPCYAPSGTMGANVASTDAQNTAMALLKALPIYSFSAVSTAWHNTPASVENYWGWGTC